MLALNEDFVYRKIFGVNLLIPVRRNSISNEALFVNNTAGFIIEKCHHSANSHELAMMLCKEFINIEPEKVYTELKSYIDNLIASKLLVER